MPLSDVHGIHYKQHPVVLPGVRLDTRSNRATTATTTTNVCLIMHHHVIATDQSLVSSIERHATHPSTPQQRHRQHSTIHRSSPLQLGNCDGKISSLSILELENAGPWDCRRVHASATLECWGGRGDANIDHPVSLATSGERVITPFTLCLSFAARDSRNTTSPHGARYVYAHGSCQPRIFRHPKSINLPWFALRKRTAYIYRYTALLSILMQHNTSVLCLILQESVPELKKKKSPHSEKWRTYNMAGRKHSPNPFCGVWHIICEQIPEWHNFHRLYGKSKE